MSSAAPLKADVAMVHICPPVSVVVGDVIDIGESLGWFAAAGSISRLKE